MCILANILSFYNFFELFQTSVAQNHPQLQIWPKKWIRLGQNGQIWSFCTIFYLFPQNEAEIDFEWSISPDLQLFPIFFHQSVSFLGKSQNVSFLVKGRCTPAIFLSFPTFLNCFTPMWLKIAHNCKFGQKSGLDWVKMAKFSHFAGFSIFSSKMRLELTHNGQFYLIHNPN